MAGILLFNLDGFVRLNPAGGAWRESSAPAARPLVVARALQELGIQPGDKVGVIGYAYDSFWARLAHVRITAEMLDDDAETLWRGDAVMQQSVLQSFADSGIRAVIAEYVPSHADMSGWQRIGETSFYIYIFPEQ
jgi:hypothetical protein